MLTPEAGKQWGCVANTRVRRRSQGNTSLRGPASACEVQRTNGIAPGAASRRRVPHPGTTPHGLPRILPAWGRRPAHHGAESQLARCPHGSGQPVTAQRTGHTSASSDSVKPEIGGPEVPASTQVRLETLIGQGRPSDRSIFLRNRVARRDSTQ